VGGGGGGAGGGGGGGGGGWNCRRVCGEALMCGRHECSLLCCSASSSLDGHVCVALCGRKMACRKHRCSRLCHKGPCGPCLEYFHELQTCTCGLTQRVAPVICAEAFQPVQIVKSWLFLPDSHTHTHKHTHMHARTHTHTRCVHTHTQWDCPYPCSRPRACGHEDELSKAHRCAPHAPACPPCKTLVSVNCKCGKIESCHA